MSATGEKSAVNVAVADQASGSSRSRRSSAAVPKGAASARTPETHAAFGGAAAGSGGVGASGAALPPRGETPARPSFSEVAADEWAALQAELHGVEPSPALPMLPSDEALMAGIVEHLEAWGGWRGGSSIVGCRLSDRMGLTICEIPAGSQGWALLRRLVREGRLEERQRVKGRRDFYSVFRVPPGT